MNKEEMVTILRRLEAGILDDVSRNYDIYQDWYNDNLHKEIEAINEAIKIIKEGK
jgi:hypothetical protein